jgi:4a-hydroxytetrahydrobiopterin dehydratase
MPALSHRKLTDQEVEESLRNAPDWRQETGEIMREFEFKTYKDGALFAAAVAYVADGLDHHPDLMLGYRKVSIRVSTHSVGGLSPYDFELARRIDGLA